MSEQDNITQDENLETIHDERALLLEQANKLGLKVSGNIGLETLRTRIKDHMEGNTSNDKDSEDEEEKQGEKPEATVKSLTRAERIKAHRAEHLALKRIIVTCMDPSKKELEGEVFTIANKFLGKVSKFVPFGNEEGWHVPKVLVEDIKARRFTYVKTVRRNGVDVVVPESMKDMPAYAVMELPQLTAKELQELKQRQAMNSGTGD